MKYRQITIIPVLNGFEVHVGCQTAVFTGFRTMPAELGKYYRCPEETEKRYLENSFKSYELPPQAPAPMPANRIGLLQPAGGATSTEAAVRTRPGEPLA